MGKEGEIRGKIDTYKEFLSDGPFSREMLEQKVAEKEFTLQSAAMEIKNLSIEEKLKVMEAIWEDILKEDEDVIESPDWHQRALQETERRFSAGEEELIDWQTAKKELRRRFE